MSGAGWEKKVNKKRHVPITGFGCLGWAGFVLFFVGFLMDESKLVLSGAHTSKLHLVHLICLTQKGGDYGVAF